MKHGNRRASSEKKMMGAEAKADTAYPGVQGALHRTS
jgi:hypothetical protein